MTNHTKCNRMKLRTKRTAQMLFLFSEKLEPVQVNEIIKTIKTVQTDIRKERKEGRKICGR